MSGPPPAARGCKKRAKKAKYSDLERHYSDNDDFFVDPRLDGVELKDISPARCCRLWFWMPWCAIFCMLLKLAIFLPFYCCFHGAKVRVEGAWKGLRLCCQGFPGYGAMLLAFMGLEGLDYEVPSIADAISSGQFHVPSRDLPPMNRRKSQYLSKLFGVEWWVGDTDYDFPGCENHIYNSVVWFVKAVVNKWMLHRPKSFWGNGNAVQGKKEFLAMLKHVLGRGGGGAKSRVDILDPNTEAGLRRFCTQGFASNFLTKHEDGYAVDMSWMEELRVRPRYSKYGGCVVLSEDLLQVKYLKLHGKTFYPKDPEFVGAAMVLKTSSVLFQIGGVHGILVHMMVSNWVTLACRSSLPPDHPLRRLLAPFQIWTSYVDCYCEAIIVSPGGVVERGGAQVEGDAELLYRRTCDTFHYETLPQEFQRKGLYKFCSEQVGHNTFPYGTEGLHLWNCYEKFVKGYFDLYYESDEQVSEDKELAVFFRALGDLWVAPTVTSPPTAVSTKQEVVDFAVWFMWHVTAIHEHTGYVGDYFHEYDSCWSMVNEGELDKLTSLLPSVQDTLQVTFVHVLTTRPGLPLCQDFSGYMLDSAKQHVLDFLKDLDRLHRDMEARDEQREEPFRTFDPYCLEISVAV